MKAEIRVQWQNADEVWCTLKMDMREVVKYDHNGLTVLYANGNMLKTPYHDILESTPMYAVGGTQWTACNISYTPKGAEGAKLELLNGTGRIVDIPIDKLNEFLRTANFVRHMDLCPADDLVPADINRIKGFRLGAGLSRAEASRQSGIPLRTLENWESGRVRPCDVRLLQKLAKLYNCYIEDLIGGDTDD